MVGLSSTTVNTTTYIIENEDWESTSHFLVKLLQKVTVHVVGLYTQWGRLLPATTIFVVFPYPR